MGKYYLKNNLWIFILIGIISLNANSVKAFNSTLQRELVRVSENISENELQLRNLKDYQELLTLKQKTNKQQLIQIQSNLNNVIIALYKMQHTSIQYLFASNKSTSDIAVTYSLFNYYVQYLRNQLQQGLEYLYIINKNQKKLLDINYKIRLTNKKLKQNKKVLLSYLHKKNYMTASQLQQINSYNSYVKKNKFTLYALMNEINHSYMLQEDIQADTNVLKHKKQFVYPNNGFIVQKYHKAKTTDLYYNGILILANPSSQIVAPYDGEVVYAKSFYAYNNIIIIKHSSSYFSIISGKLKPFVKTTQLVKKHEPIAISAPENAPIYYELENKNKPINPLPWFLQPAT